PIRRVDATDRRIRMLQGRHRPGDLRRPAAGVRRLGEVGIPDPERRMKAFPHELSGGMQQRAMIAMALAGCPQLLIADEPTTALDVTIQAQILELLSYLRSRSGMSVLIVTHNLSVVSRIADRVAVMYAGDIVECGPTRHVIDSPIHPYTRALVAAVPRLGAKVDRLTSIPGMVPSADKFGRGCRFFDRCAMVAELDEERRARCRDVVPDEKHGDCISCRCHLVEVEEDR
ncbi:MAG: ABC transporter ATP-binding protein, partial [Victivallaceae bacterium]|nr:ABC transporter ATP-binding protein [Victivallaceae bacterium]